MVGTSTGSDTRCDFSHRHHTWDSLPGKGTQVAPQNEIVFVLGMLNVLVFQKSPTCGLPKTKALDKLLVVLEMCYTQCCATRQDDTIRIDMLNVDHIAARSEPPPRSWSLAATTLVLLFLACCHSLVSWWGRRIFTTIGQRLQLIQRRLKIIVPGLVIRYHTQR